MVGVFLLRAWDGAGYLDGYFAFKGADVSTAIHLQCSIVLGPFVHYIDGCHRSLILSALSTSTVPCCRTDSDRHVVLPANSSPSFVFDPNIDHTSHQ